MMSEDNSSRMGGVKQDGNKLGTRSRRAGGADADYKNIYIRLIIIIIIIINIFFLTSQFLENSHRQ